MEKPVNVTRTEGGSVTEALPKGFTYFIRAGDHIKIGSSMEPVARIKAMQTSIAHELETLAIVPMEVADEMATHQTFHHLRVRGEWFQATPELLNFIRRLKGEPELPVEPASTLGSLIEQYRTHKASTFHKLAYDNRKNTLRLTERMDEQYGSTPLAEIRASTIRIWHDGWAEGGKISMAHSFIAQLRTMLGFGLLMLEDRECERLCVTMSKLKFEQAKVSEASLSPEQADAIREAARRHFGWYSLALAQAFQFELVLRQRDVIGQWVPESEPGESDIRYNGLKWRAGIRWSEVADDMVLRHRTNKRQKMMAADLKLCPMIQDELRYLNYRSPDGPIIINDVTGLPWSANEFRRKWRLVANHCGIPKEIKDMHSRSGGISEMFRAGVRPDAIMTMATHSDLAMTMRYNRQNHLDTSTEGQLARLEYRNRKAGE